MGKAFYLTKSTKCGTSEAISNFDARAILQWVYEPTSNDS